MRSMTRPARAALTAAAVLAVMLQPASALGGCKLMKVAELNIAIPGIPVVEVSLNGHPTMLLLDTGSWISLIWKSSIESYQLQRVNVKGDATCGAGGCSDSELVSVKDFTLGDTVVHDLRFQAVPAALGDSRIAGVFGQDLLGQMDVEFDLPGGHVRLFRPQDCSGDQVVYWANAFNMVKLRTDPTPNRKLWLPVSLNGHELMGFLDSGASHSAVMTRVTQRAGLGPETPLESVGEKGGIGQGKVSAAQARFASLSIGQETIQHPSLQVADWFAADREAHAGSLIKQSGFEEPDIIIGAEFFRMHRIYIANSQGRIYFTYQPGAPAGAAASTAAMPSPPQNAAQ